MSTLKSKTKRFKTLTKGQREELTELAGVLTKVQIAHRFCMSFNTFDAICKREPEVQMLYDKGLSIAVADIGLALYKKAKSGDVNAMKFYLERYAGRIPESIVKQETKKVKTFSDMYDDENNDDEDEDED